MTTIPGSTVFAKTPRGRAEVGLRRSPIGAVQRQMLIVIDGRRDVRALAALFGKADVMQLLTALRQAGLIDTDLQCSHGVAPAPAPAEGLGQARALMRSAAEECIGLLAAPLVARIDGARSLDALAVVAGQWHMALRDSKRGRARADRLLDEVKAMLGWRGPVCGDMRAPP